MPPAPKRSEQRRRTNKVPGLERGAAGVAPKIPPVRKEWHPAAKAWYQSLKVSGQSQWYEQSDWAQAWIGAELISDVLLSEKRSPTMVHQWLAMASELMVTEGSRRRLHVELERLKLEKNKPVLEIADYRERFSG